MSAETFDDRHTSTPERAAEPSMPRPRRVAVVFNPSSGGGTSDGRREEIKGALDGQDVGTTWYETTPEDSGYGATRAAVEAGADLVIAVGGDGTVMACATVLAGTEIPLAVVPAGTGNLVATNFDLPSDLEEAVEIALGCRRRRIDVGALGSDRFVGMAGIGFDAAMIRDADHRLKSRVGHLAYVLSALRNLRRPRRRYRLRLDGGAPFQRSAQGVTVGNLGRLQGGLPALPDAVPDDGLLDVIVFKSRSVADWLALAWWAVGRWVWRSGADRPQTIEIHRARRIEVDCDRPQPVERDGDLLEPSRSFVVEVVPQALTLAVPAQHLEGTAPVRRDT